MEDIIVFNTIVYFVTRGLKNIWYNRLMSMASAGIVSAGLILLGIFLLLGWNVQSWLVHMEEQCGVYVRLLPDAGGAALDQIENQLKSIPGVQDVYLYSYQEQVPENDSVQTVWRDAYFVSLSDLSVASVVAQAAEKVQGVEEVRDGQEQAEKIQKMTSAMRKFGLWIAVILILSALCIVMNTIRLGLLSRGRELEIMRIVGASNWYIRGPFVVEGVTLGLIGAGIAAVIVLAGYRAAIETLGGMEQMPLLLPVEQIQKWVLGIFALLGVLIGFWGSFVSTCRYLKN
ncbi:permease-like cell division protein FtsX [Ructibacterium gallinarum]|uniref:Cell division protein FtsX n=1 Tax=Ructibacterium gallinarum TaxID=2779355 RepID=A0A9D5LX75_9FIRM|nr:permease-like cell division protein FtsX [Ructibacterium gallinarum]MBE5039498.1 hypothetical protein [Ructibacterium gallinarum]